MPILAPSWCIPVMQLPEMHIWGAMWCSHPEDWFSCSCTRVLLPTAAAKSNSSIRWVEFIARVPGLLLPALITHSSDRYWQLMSSGIKAQDGCLGHLLNGGLWGPGQHLVLIDLRKTCCFPNTWFMPPRWLHSNRWMEIILFFDHNRWGNSTP